MTVMLGHLLVVGMSWIRWCRRFFLSIVTCGGSYGVYILNALFHFSSNPGTVARLVAALLELLYSCGICEKHFDCVVVKIFHCTFK